MDKRAHVLEQLRGDKDAGVVAKQHASPNRKAGADASATAQVNDTPHNTG